MCVENRIVTLHQRDPASGRCGILSSIRQTELIGTDHLKILPHLIGAALDLFGELTSRCACIRTFLGKREIPVLQQCQRPFSGHRQRIPERKRTIDFSGSGFEIIRYVRTV